MDRLDSSNTRPKPVSPGRLLFCGAALATIMISIGVSALLRVQDARGDNPHHTETPAQNGSSSNQLVLLNPVQ